MHFPSSELLNNSTPAPEHAAIYYARAYCIVMSSQNMLIQSDIESNSSETETRIEMLPQSDISDNVKKLIFQAESKLKVKPLSMKFSPRYEAAGDEFWKAGQELCSSQQYSQGCRVLVRCAHSYLRANHLIR